MADELIVDCSTGEETVQTMSAEDLAALEATQADAQAVIATVVDPLKDYRDALTTAANADPNLAADTKTALENLLTAMAPPQA